MPLVAGRRVPVQNTTFKVRQKACGRCCPRPGGQFGGLVEQVYRISGKSPLTGAPHRLLEMLTAYRTAAAGAMLLIGTALVPARLRIASRIWAEGASARRHCGTHSFVTDRISKRVALAICSILPGSGLG